MMLPFFALLALLPLQQTLDRVEQHRANGQPREAIQLLERVRHQDPVLFQRNNLLYLQAVLYEEAGLKAEARQGFEAVLRTDFPLPDSVLLHLVWSSDALTLADRRPYYEAFLGRYPTHPRWTEVAVGFADLLAREAQNTEAADWYRKLVAGSRANREASLKLARLLLQDAASRAQTEGLGLLKRLITENDRDQFAVEAVTELRNRESFDALTENELYRRAVIFVNSRTAPAARRYLERLLALYPESAARAEYKYLVGRNLQNEGKRREAIAAYTAAYCDFPRSSWGITSQYQAGIVHLGLGEYQEAAAAFEKILKNPDARVDWDRAAVSLAEARAWLGDRAGAIDILRAGLSTTKDPSRLHYPIARLSLESGQYHAALESLSAISHLSSVQLPSGVTREEVLYWKGRCEEQLQLTEASLLSFQQALQGRPNYFADLARQRLAAESIAEALKPSVKSQSDALSGWAIGGRSVVVSLAAPAPGVLQNPDLLRLQELLFLRLHDEAYRLLRRPECARLFPKKSDYLLQLAQLADRAGLHRESLETAEELRQLLYGATAPDYYPESIRRLLYPRHYWKLVVKYGTRHGVDPYLLLALIRQESAFQADAVSSASAVGLMQLVPATARQLAGRLKIKFRPDSLREPATSIQLGTFYFRQLLDRHDGSLEKTLAAYNGGGSNVRRWEQKVPGQDPALFVANIGFRETKLYVARVLGHYWTYRRLYAGQ